MLKNDKSFDDRQKFCKKIVDKTVLKTLTPGNLESSSPANLGKSLQ